MENSANPKLEKEFNKWKKNKEKKLPAKELKENKILAKRALSLWKQIVKKQAMGICEAPLCRKTKKLNAHHIESFSTNKGLRFEPRNGICLCSTHHKFGRSSAHKSFCFVFIIMTTFRRNDLSFLLQYHNTKVELTKQFLCKTIISLERTVIHLGGKV